MDRFLILFLFKFEIIMWYCKGPEILNTCLQDLSLRTKKKKKTFTLDEWIVLVM